MRACSPTRRSARASACPTPAQARELFTVLFIPFRELTPNNANNHVDRQEDEQARGNHKGS